MASAYLNHTFPSGPLVGVEVGGGVRHLGESFADDVNARVVSHVTLFDTRLAYERDT